MTYEFRVFFPILCEADEDLWIDDNLKIPYIRKVDEYLTKLRNSSSNILEERTDTYILNHCDSYGLKYRSGTKLELKIMMDRTENGIEKYIKTKYGKKGLKHHINKIIKTITQSTMTKSSSFSHLQIDNPKTLNTYKKRAKSDIRPIRGDSEFTEELCYCQTGYNSPPQTSSYNLSNTTTNTTTNPQVHIRKWFTIVIETDNLNEINSYLRSPSADHLWQLCQLALDIVLADYSYSSKLSFFPFIGGYPKFIMYIEGLLSMEEKEVTLFEFRDLIHKFRPTEAVKSEPTIEKV